MLITEGADHPNASTEEGTAAPTKGGLVIANGVSDATQRTDAGLISGGITLEEHVFRKMIMLKKRMEKSCVLSAIASMITEISA